MKRTITIILMIAILNLLAFAKPVKRIVFKKGATKTVVYGYLNGYKDEQTFVIRVRAGQIIRVETEGRGNDSYTSVSITSPSGEFFWNADASCHSGAETTEGYSDRKNGSHTTVAGDYKISVNECKKADPWKDKFKLTVKVIEGDSK